LRIAAARGHTGAVRLLLDQGADANLGVRGRGQGTALEAAKAGGHGDVVKILNKIVVVDAFQGAKEEGEGMDEAETPLIPHWFIPDDFEAAEPLRVQAPLRNSAHMPAWFDYDDADFKVSPSELVAPDTMLPVTPLKRAMALQYMIDADGSYGFMEMDDEKVGLDQVNMPVAWLRT
jgi:hypothetical protein